MASSMDMEEHVADATGAAETANEEVPMETPVQGPPADPVLLALYNSQRPVVELLPGVALSPIVHACWLGGDAKALLAETWLPTPAEEAEETPSAPPPAFNAAAPEYNEMVKRLSKSAAFLKWNSLTIQIAECEAVVKSLKGEELQAKQAELEAARTALADTEVVLTELKASFNEDPLSLVGWMQTLFDLADGGMTTFDVSGSFWPYCNLRSLFTSDNTRSYFDGVEKVLGTFKRRYEKERGPNKIQILTKLAPNIFQDGFNPAGLEAVVDAVRVNLYGAESTEPLELVQLVWWDLKETDALAVLKVLQKLLEDKLEISEEGEVTITEPKKIRGIGLVDFPPAAIKAALQAGVAITSVQLPLSVADRSHAATLDFCKEYGIKVLARGGTLGGLISEKYIGLPCPDTISGDADLDSVAACLDQVNNLGGWQQLQALLQRVKAVADKHEVKLETVALRWLIDQGTFPLATTRWGQAGWGQFGPKGATSGPGVDSVLFQVGSFLDQEDTQALSHLHLNLH